jgi:hypothetical protein
MEIVRACMAGEVHDAHQRLEDLWAKVRPPARLLSLSRLSGSAPFAFLASLTSLSL